MDNWEDTGTGNSTADAYNVIFDAPDYSSLVRHRETAVSREYTSRVRSIVKAGTLGCIRTGNFPDAAALLEHGDQWARAAGDLASESDRARRYLDILTAPDSPYLGFAMTSIALVSQLARNHADGIQAATASRKDRRKKRKAAVAEGIIPEGSVTWKIPLIRKEVRLGFRIRPKAILTRIAGVFQGATQPPADLAFRVFSDEDLIKALAKQGINITRAGE